MQLAYQGIVKIIPICALVTLATILFAVVIAPPQGFLSWFVYSLLVMVFATFVAWLTLEIFRTKIGVNESHLVITKGFRKRQRIAWSEIERIDYNSLWSSFVVVTDTGQRIFISTLMSNLKHFLSVMAVALPREKYIDGLDKFAKAIDG